jgi:GT2 family glycosyltransferase
MVNWNQKSNVLESISSVIQSDYERLTLVVVDNGSQDGSVEAIRTQFPDVTLLENDTNLGAPIALNQGMEYALQNGAAYICLMDNDISVDRQMVRELVLAAEVDPHIAATGPKMYYHSLPALVWCAGAVIDWRTGDNIRLQAEQADDGETIDQPKDVDMIPSCAFLIRRDALAKVGLMDHRYFVYYNDTDWCARATAQGWRIVYVPTARLWHKVSATMKSASPATDYYMTRNAFLFLAKNQHGAEQVRSLLWTAGRDLLAIAAYTAKSHGGHRIPNRNARVLALRDALLARWGKMGPDVARVCYPGDR